MKKQILLIIMLFASICIYAQDVIIKQDGTTIPANVISVGRTEIEYTLLNDPDSLPHGIEISEVYSINYKDGRRIFFAEQVSTSSYLEENISNALNEALNRALYNSTVGRGKITAGGIIIATCVPSILSGVITLSLGHSAAEGIPLLVGGLVGTSIGSALVGVGKHQRKEALGITSSSILQNSYKKGKYTLTPSLNIYNDHITKKHGLGAGLALRF